MTRALASLFAAGAALVAVTLAISREDGTDVPAIAVAVGLAFLVAGLLAAAGGRLRSRSLHAALAAGTLLITQCVVFGGPAADAYAVMYVWVALYACFFFRPVPAVAHVVGAAALYGVVLLTTGDPNPVPGVHWVMAVGTIAVGAMLVGGLTRAIRDRAVDLAAVAQMANDVSDVPSFGRAACEGLHRSVRADVVVMLEPSDDDGMEVSALAGAPDAGLVFGGERARRALEDAARLGEPQVIVADAPPTGRRRFDGSVLGLAQPILREGAAAGVIAFAWTRGRRAIPERARTAAGLFAAEASVAIDRAASRSRDRGRAAIEINDNIVQGLVVAKYLASAGQSEASVAAIDETLARARRLITDQLDEVARAGGRIEPGDLAREEASPVGAPTTVLS